MAVNIEAKIPKDNVIENPLIGPDPKTKWFGPNNSHLDTKDLYPEHWEIL